MITYTLNLLDKIKRDIQVIDLEVDTNFNKSKRIISLIETDFNKLKTAKYYNLISLYFIIGLLYENQ